MHMRLHVGAGARRYCGRQHMRGLHPLHLHALVLQPPGYSARLQQLTKVNDV